MQTRSQRNILVIVLLLVIETMGFAFVAPVFTPLLLKSHIFLNVAGQYQRILVLGLLNAVYPLGMFIATPLLGRLSDRVGRKRVFLLSVSGTLIGYVITGLGIYSHSLLLALAGRAIDGLTAGSVPIAQATMADLSKGLHNKVRLMGLSVLGFAGGQALGPMLSGVLSDSAISHAFGAALPFYVVGVLSLFNLLWICFGFRETFKASAQPSVSTERPKTLLFKRITWLLGLGLLMHQLAISLYMQSMPTILLEQLHFSGLKISWYAALAGIVMAISVSFVLPKLSKKFPIKTVFISLFSLQAFSILISYAFRYELTYWLAIVLVIFGTSQSYALFLTCFSESIDKQHQGNLLGIATAIMALSWAITAVLAGVLPALGGIYLPIIVAAMFSAVGTFSVMRWHAEQQTLRHS